MHTSSQLGNNPSHIEGGKVFWKCFFVPREQISQPLQIKSKEYREIPKTRHFNCFLFTSISQTNHTKKAEKSRPVHLRSIAWNLGNNNTESWFRLTCHDIKFNIILYLEPLCLFLTTVTQAARTRMFILASKILTWKTLDNYLSSQLAKNRMFSDLQNKNPLKIKFCLKKKKRH